MDEIERVYATGHYNVQCSHRTTIELTKDVNITPRGTCILGVNASKACNDLSNDLKKFIKNGEKIEVEIILDNIVESFHGFGHANLSLTDENDMVFRTSNFICDRTVLINCSKASCNINRDIIEKLKNPGKNFALIFKRKEI